MKCLGLMSGTSLDGVDCAIVDIRPGRSVLRIDLLARRTHPYPPALRRRILALVRSGTTEDVCRLHAAVGEMFARTAQQTIRQANVSSGQIALIGSHGQTVWHSPRGIRVPGAGSVRSTLQIGDPSVIAERTGITTVADFRARDMAAGGEGAPLTPYIHYQLFQSRRRSRLIVNLGGIANVTYLPGGGGLTDVLAFDTGPCNLLLDGLMAAATRGRRLMDRHGALAARGRHRESVMRCVLAHPFFARRPPKSTGREEFDERYVRRVRQRAARHGASLEDTLASSCAGIACAIARSRRWLSGPVDEVIVGGGGARNRGLMAALEQRCGPSRVMTMEHAGVDGKAVEAMACAVFAYQTLRGVPVNLPSVTGARSPVVLGTIAPGRHVAFRVVTRSQAP